MSEEENDELVKDFSVEETMHSVKDRYVEDHDRAINAIHEKIEDRKHSDNPNN